MSEVVVKELCAVLFPLLSRRGRRLRAEQYLRGLLSATGRKSIRNIAAQVGGPGIEQSLHHFITSSAWPWRPLRAALAGYMENTVAPVAWVVRPLDIPKAGSHSVGVDEHFAPHLGQVYRGQQAQGVWLTSPELSAPVNWRMVVPEPWITDSGRRKQADVPGDLRPESREECAVSAVLQMVQGWDMPARPVLLDMRQGPVLAATSRLSTAGVSFLARVSPSCRLLVADPASPGHRAGALAAQRVANMVTGRRTPVPWHDVVRGTPRTTTATTVPVVLPGGARPRQLSLLAEWADPAGPCSGLWLTNMTSASLFSLLRLSKLEDRTETDFARIGSRAGLRDFAGRSFCGWHRHMTLASIAHTATALSTNG
ncbi:MULTISPECIES: transposase [unclassified Streptomyces]|uniref:Transposase n=1 Tax=Streptomyces evansiae TaxID=3075535 RepID=A0ABU2QYQ7_9ACTN|nr:MULTISPECIES: transposase [unclassified Streptomyces]MDT0409584.1 transposase [Streptomyces sp. DSM 41979]